MDLIIWLPLSSLGWPKLVPQSIVKDAKRVS